MDNTHHIFTTQRNVGSTNRLLIDEIVVFEDAVRRPIVAQEPPDVFDPIELGTYRRQRHNGDVWWHDESRRQVPAGLIDQEYGVCAGRDLRAMVRTPTPAPRATFSRAG